MGDRGDGNDCVVELKLVGVKNGCWKVIGCMSTGVSSLACCDCRGGVGVESEDLAAEPGRELMDASAFFSSLVSSLTSNSSPSESSDLELELVCLRPSSLSPLPFRFRPLCEDLAEAAVQSMILPVLVFSASTTLISIPRPHDSSSSSALFEPL